MNVYYFLHFTNQNLIKAGNYEKYIKNTKQNH